MARKKSKKSYKRILGGHVKVTKGYYRLCTAPDKTKYFTRLYSRKR